MTYLIAVCPPDLNISPPDVKHLCGGMSRLGRQIIWRRYVTYLTLFCQFGHVFVLYIPLRSDMIAVIFEYLLISVHVVAIFYFSISESQFSHPVHTAPYAGWQTQI